MRKRMYALLLAGVMVFSQSGLTVMAADAVETETPAVVQAATTVTPNKTSIPATGGYIIFTTDDKVEDWSVWVGDQELVEEQDYYVDVTSSIRTVVGFFENPGTEARTLTVILDGIETEITQEAAENTGITGVTLVSRTFLADGKTEFVYDVEGQDLQEVGIRVKEGVNKTINASKYEVKREGTGEKQRVTITFVPYSQLGEFDDVLNWTIRFYPSSSDMTSSDYKTADIQIFKDETPAADTAITSVTASAETAAYANGTVELTVAGTGLDTADLEVTADPADGVSVGTFAGTATEQKVTVTFPVNATTSPVAYKLSVGLKGQEEKKDVTVNVNGANTISGADALKEPANILDVRELETRNSVGHVPGSMFCPQFPLDDPSLDAVMQTYAQRFIGTTQPIYVLCKGGVKGAQRATKNLLTAGVEPERIFTIVKGATDTDIKAALTTDRFNDPIEWNYVDAQTAVDAANDANSGVHMLDTRKASLYKAGHLRRSVSMPVLDEDGVIQAELLNELAAFAVENYLSDEEPIYILCNSGNKLAKTAVSLMMDVGISLDRLFIIQGGAAGEIVKANLIVEGEWVADSVGVWYKNPDGSYPKACWKQIDGYWYHFDAKGYRETGWKKINSKWYFFDEDGVMLADGWLEDGEDYYYLDENGAMVTGWLPQEEGWYYLASNGKMVTGWVKSSGKWYYMDDETGIMLEETGIVDEDGNVYYLKKGGAMATGWQLIEGDYYYFASNGKMVTGWVQSKNVWYYMDKTEGYMLEEAWTPEGNYYLKAGGAMATGWEKIDGEWYYFSSTGKKVVSKWVGNYYLSEDGTMATSEWVDGGKYYVDENGKWDPSKTK